MGEVWKERKEGGERCGRRGREEERGGRTGKGKRGRNEESIMKEERRAEGGDGLLSDGTKEMKDGEVGGDKN